MDINGNIFSTLRDQRRIMLVTVKIPYMRFKAWHGGKYYDEDYFEYDIDSNFFNMSEEEKSEHYHYMHSVILPQLCKEVGKDFFIVVTLDDFIGWPYLWIPEKVTYTYNE